MNIFVLHEDPIKAAEAHYDTHIDYYAYGKSHLLKYTNTDKPDWLVARSLK